MTEPKKTSAVQFVTQIESVRMTNWFIRTAWKTAAGLIALTFRLITWIVLGIIRGIQRRRTNW
jgi:hypothetical protein